MIAFGEELYLAVSSTIMTLRTRSLSCLNTPLLCFVMISKIDRTQHADVRVKQISAQSESVDRITLIYENNANATSFLYQPKHICINLKPNEVENRKWAYTFW